MAKSTKSADVSNQQEVVVSEQKVETSLAPTMPSSNVFALNKALAERLPLDHKDRERVLMLERPSPAMLIEAIGQLPEEWQPKVMSLVRRMRPIKQGLHIQGSGFKVGEIKLFHGVGNDPSRPERLAPGSFYSSDSRSFDNAFVGAVIGVHQGRTLWPQADGQRSRPLCYSLDVRQGTTMGECASCVHATKKWSEGGCAPEVTVDLIDREMTGVYRIKFAKTAHRGGEHLMKLVSGDDELWSRWIKFSSTENKDGSKRWYGIQASPLPSANPAEIFTPKSLDVVFRAISQALDCEVFYPALADVYDRVKAAASSNDVTPVADLGDEPPDFSNA